jgi:hypothetical protein
MEKVLFALRKPDDNLLSRLPEVLPGVRRWTLEVSQPGQELLVAAGLRFDGQAIYDALLWCWFDEPIVAAVSGLGEVGAVLHVQESVGWDRSDDGGGALGPETVKMVSFVVRRPEVERRKFDRDYAEHVAVARVHHPGVWRYVQNLVIDGTGPGADGVEAVSELWYQSGEEFVTRFYENDESPGVVKADNEEYIDFARTRSLIVLASPNGVP